MALSYRSASIGAAAPAAETEVRALQCDLRRLGYLLRGIDGVLGDGTRAAIRALQHDLLRNDGSSTAEDGAAPVAVNSYNRGVTAVTGIADPALVDSIEAMLSDDHFPKLPFSDNPAADNATVLAAAAALRSTVVPVPYLLAIFKQESDNQHYQVPRGHDADNFVTLGLDRKDDDKARVTSRGYGLGQYTLFHHPPTTAEIANFIMDPAGNVQTAIHELRDKFDKFIAGPTPGTTADDRKREHPLLTLRLCRYQRSDPKYMRDCKACAVEAGTTDIIASTPFCEGSSETYGQAPLYPSPHYIGVPVRAAFQCDWPYAVRRYNGSGANSYNYQAIVLRNLLSVALPGAELPP